MDAKNDTQGVESPAIIRDYEDALPIALLRTREAVMRRFRPHLSRQDLTEQQWRVIRAIAASEELDATSLAEMCCILMPSLSRILKSLEKRGLLERSKAAADGRRQTIRLTEQGAKLFAQMAPESEEIYQLIESRVGKQELDQLVRSMRALQDALKS